MNKTDRDIVRNTVLDSIEIIRRSRPDIVFEINITSWREGEYHIELVARKSLYVSSERKVIARDLLTRNHGKLMTFNRVAWMYKTLNDKEIIELRKEFTDGIGRSTKS